MASDTRTPTTHPPHKLPPRANPKVVHLSDPYLVDRTAPPQAPMQEAQPHHSPASADYVPLALIGQITEKGFSTAGPKQKQVSAPQPRATPFPVARHRSEGPHWGPLLWQTVAVSQDKEDAGAEILAAQALPLERKKKDAQFSRWKQQQVSAGTKNEVEKAQKGETQGLGGKSISPQDLASDRGSMPCEFSGLDHRDDENYDLELPNQTCEEPLMSAKDEANHFSQTISQDAVERPRKAEEVEGAKASGTRNTLNSSGRTFEASGQDFQSKESSLRREIEKIDSENRATLLSMSDAEIAEAQGALTERLRPDILEMLRRRGADKERERLKYPRSDSLKTVCDQNIMEDSKSSSQPTVVLSSNNQLKADSRTELLPFFSNREIGNIKKDEHMGACTTSPKGNSLAEEAGDSLIHTSDSTTVSESCKSWTDRVEAVRLLKFGLDGNVVFTQSTDEGTAATSSEDGLHQRNPFSVAERDILRTDGNPAGEGYSIKEAVALTRSMVPAQRAVALRLLALILDKALTGLHSADLQNRVAAFPNADVVDWQAVWAYALGPESELVLSLRIALDDSHATVVVNCAKALQALLSFHANEYYFNLREVYWPCDKDCFTAPIFRKPTKQEEGFLGGGKWKYNVKSSQMFPFSEKSGSENAEEDATVGGDANVANQDVAAGLIRMGVLPRIRYILEVEKLAAAEEQLLNVLIAFCRHSPTMADAVMKCPRLLDTITHIFLRRDKNLHIDMSPIEINAIQLLKVLSQVKRSNCVQLMGMGVFRAALQGLLQHGLTLRTHSKTSQEMGILCNGLVDSLRLWRVCIHYGIGISLFSEIYPALCFWICPPFDTDIHNLSTAMEAGVLAQESYSVLERLAMTLPILHGDDKPVDFKAKTVLSEGSMDASLNWSWSYATPLVETSLGWFSCDIISCMVTGLEELATGKENKATLKGASVFLGTLASVFHFLSTIFERILPSEAHPLSSNLKSFWLPTFVPKVGLQLAKSGLLTLSSNNSQGGSPSLPNTKTSFVRCFLGLKERFDEEALLAASSCLYGLVRLVRILDHLMASARNASVLVHSNDLKTSSEAEEAVACGLTTSAEMELIDLYIVVGKDVIRNSQILQKSEINGRGGPAPGVGVGWGCPGGGFWSTDALISQANARLTTELIEIFGRKLNVGSVLHDCMEKAGGERYTYLHTDKCVSLATNLLWNINVGLSIVTLAGPADTDLVERVFSSVILHVRTLKVLVDETGQLVEKWIWKLKKEHDSHAKKNAFEYWKSKPEEIGMVLRQHFRNVWLHSKTKEVRGKDKESNEPVNVKKVNWSPSLFKVQENVSHVMEVECMHSTMDFLVTEWAGQRLPLPSHWFLSALSPFFSMSTEKGSRDNGKSGIIQSKVKRHINGSITDMEDVLRYGLILLCGMESMAADATDIQTSGVCSVPLVRKIHALSCIFVLADDAFLHVDLRIMIGALQELYGYLVDGISLRPVSVGKQCIEEEACIKRRDAAEALGLSENQTQDYLLDFEGKVNERYDFFVEALANQFGSVSFGEPIFGRQVALYLKRNVADTLRLKIWGVLTSEHILDLLPPIEQCCGHFRSYLYPFEQNQEILKSYISAWGGGALDKAMARSSITFSLALHHVAAFLFRERDLDDKLLLRKTFARSLILGLFHRSQQKDSLLKLLMYDWQFVTISGSLESKTVPNSTNLEEIKMRCQFLLEACVGYPALCEQVQLLQTMIPLQL